MLKSVSFAALAVALIAGAAQAQTQPLPMPAPATAPLPEPKDIDYPGTIRLFVDASDTDHHVIAMREVIPVVTPGPMTLLLPMWLPGHHSAEDADLSKIAGLHVFAGDKELKWRRDNVAMGAFHIEVPDGAKEIEVRFQYLSPVTRREGVIVHTRNSLTLQWENESLYPAGYFTRRIPIEVSLTLPKDWQYGSALEAARREGDTVHFKPVSYENFIDSPLIAGRYFKRYDLDPGAKTPVWFDVVADKPSELEISEPVLDIHRKMVDEAYALFGGKHYAHYDWLIAVSDQMGDIGLEHHQSSEIGIEPGYFASNAGKGYGRNIIAHEYIHSWDGKFRRPAGQFTGDFQQPMRDELLWVYEGGTTYWTWVLEARAGLYSLDQSLQMVAATMAYHDTLPGRQWRDLQDTTYDPIISNRAPKSWPSWQRSEDYYAEGGLIWLEADTLIREKTDGKRSLDDFARGFFGIYDGSIIPATYGFNDVVAALNDVYPYDWASFLKERLARTGTGAPLDSLARAGYRLVYNDKPTDFALSNEAKRGLNLSTSLGMTLSKDGYVRDVVWDGPAFKLGLAPGPKVVAVNGLAFDAQKLKDAILAAKSGAALDLLILDGADYRTLSFDWREGLRYPHLERIATTPDLFADIFAAKTGKAPEATAKAAKPKRRK